MIGGHRTCCFLGSSNFIKFCISRASGVICEWKNKGKKKDVKWDSAAAAAVHFAVGDATLK